MRLKLVNIKNFRSIDNIENFELIDRNITCFIGKNGSGKTNILRSIKALQDLKYLNDEYFFEKPNKGKEILISGDFVFEPQDDQLLEQGGLRRSEIEGFRVSVIKKESETASQSIEPISFKRDINAEFILTINKFILKLLKLIPPTPEATTEPATPTDNPPADAPSTETKESLMKDITDFHEKWNNTDDIGRIQLKPDILNLITQVEKLLELNKETTAQENGNEIKELIENIKNISGFNITNILTDLFNKRLKINFLGFSDYPIESNAKYVDLAKDGTHFFLKDLINLTDKNLDDFKTKGSLLINNIKDASAVLNERLGDVFKQYSLQLEISAQKEELVFVFRTPQNRVRELADLSDGEKWFLQFYTKLAIAQKESSQVVWLFDEPGQNLNSTGQIDLKKYFEEISETSQILYTSHQPVMIQWHTLERIFSVKNDNVNGTTIELRFWKDGKTESPIKDLLGLFVGEQMLTGDEQIVVEGVSDYIHLQGWLRFLKNNREAKYLKENYSLLKRTIVPAQGFPTIPLYLLFLANKSREKITTIALADNTEAGASIILQGISDRQVLSMEEVVRSVNTADDRKVIGIEDLYEPLEFLEEVKEYYAGNINLPNIKINTNFTKYSKLKLANGIVAYIEKYINDNNPNYFTDGRKIELDKTGVAMQIYKKLIFPESKGMNKNTEKIFAEIFKKLDSYFEQKVSS